MKPNYETKGLSQLLINIRPRILKMKNHSFIEFILDQLDGMEDLSIKAMFGGHGVYGGNKFFAIIFDGRLYFKIDDSSRMEYEKFGMQPFRPKKKQTLRTYYEVPVEIIEDRDLLKLWARKAIESQDG